MRTAALHAEVDGNPGLEFYEFKVCFRFDKRLSFLKDQSQDRLNLWLALASSAYTQHIKKYFILVLLNFLHWLPRLASAVPRLF